MRVKICGITSLEDALLAINAGADALGFVFYKQSPRYISPQKAHEIIQKLPPFVEKVGLFVNEDAHTINTISSQSAITLVQLHFETTVELQTELKYPFIRVIRMQSENDLKNLDENSYYLVDAFCESYGGSGKRLNLEWFKDKNCSHLILAGGLSADNVSQTQAYGFYGVDVSSGTEISHGKKDPQKVQDFIRFAKA